MKNKGFTLIELLAVIVILAIIALIATPIILSIINDARKGAAKQGAELVISNVELAYATAYTNSSVPGTAPKLSEVAAAFKMKGATMTVANGKATFTVDDTNVTCAQDEAEGKLKVTCTTSDNKTATTTADMPITAES